MKYFKHCQWVAGVDEAGRGPWAGPVVAACLMADYTIYKRLLRNQAIKDSKKLTAKTREKLFLEIISLAPVFFSIVDSKTIDDVNVLKAALMAMERAVKQSPVKPDLILVDGKQTIPNLKVEQIAIVKGDQKEKLISAASIVAKVVRDRIMVAFSQVYPDYGFARHKGYGTSLHLSALQKKGPCPLHRLSFRPLRQLRPSAV